MKNFSEIKSFLQFVFLALFFIQNWAIAQLFPPEYRNFSRTKNKDFSSIQHPHSDSDVRWQSTRFPDLPYEFSRARLDGILHNKYNFQENKLKDYYKSLQHRRSAGKSAQILDFGFELAWVNEFEDDRQSNEDYIVDVVLDSAGNIYITGASANLDHGFDFYTIKYDSAGNELWARRFDSGGDDVPVDLGMDDSSNIYILGQVDGFSNSVDLLLLKYTSEGELLWQFTYDNPENSNNYALGSVVTASGTVYLSGYHYTSSIYFVLIAVDRTGNQIWLDSSIPITQTYYADQITCDQANNVFVSGTYWGNGNYNIVTYKYDPTGNREWENLYPVDQGDVRKISVNDSGYVYVAGSYYNYGCENYLLLKYDSNGNEKWIRAYDNMGQCGRVEDLMIDQESNAYLSGSSALVKYDAAGTLKWTVEQSGEKILRRNDGHLLLIRGDFQVVLLDDNGTILWTRQPDFPPGDSRYMSECEIGISDKLTMTGGVSTRPSYNTSYFLIQTDAQGNELFRREYSGPGAHKSYTWDMQITPHGDIFVLGSSINDPVVSGYSSDGYDRVRIIDQKISSETRAEILCTNSDRSFYLVGRSGLARMTSNGNHLWTRTYDEPGSRDLHAQIHPFNGIIVAVVTASFSYSSFHIDLYHYDDSGLLLWKQTYQYTRRLHANTDYIDISITDMQVDVNGNVYLYGINKISENNYRNYSQEVFLIKYSASGNPEWNFTIDRSDIGWPHDLDLDLEGNAYILGVDQGSSYRNTPASFLIQKFDQTGAVSWSYRDQELAYTYNWYGHIQVDQQNNAVVVVSRSSAPDYISELRISKFSPWGVPVWTETYSENNSVWPNQLNVDQNGSIHILGNSRDHIGTKDAGLVLKYSSAGANEAIIHYMSQAYSYSFTTGEVDAWGNVYIANSSNGSWGTRQLQLMKYRPAHNAITKQISPEQMTLDQNAPNPFNARTRIGFTLPQIGPVNLEIFDVRGQRILSENLGLMDSGSHIHEFNARSLASGIYYYRIRQQTYSATRKMVLVK